MGIPVLILGESGSGKTYSIKNFEKNEVGVFLVEKTRLPFKKDFKIVKNATDGLDRFSADKIATQISELFKSVMGNAGVL